HPIGERKTGPAFIRVRRAWLTSSSLYGITEEYDRHRNDAHSLQGSWITRRRSQKSVAGQWLSKTNHARCPRSIPMSLFRPAKRASVFLYRSRSNICTLRDAESHLTKRNRLPHDQECV